MTYKAHLIGPINSLEDLIYMVVELLLCQSRNLTHKKHGKLAISTKKIARFISSDDDLYNAYIDLCFKRYQDKDKAYRSCITNGSLTIRNVLLKIAWDDRYKGPVKHYIKSLMILGMDGALGNDPCHIIVDNIEKTIKQHIKTLTKKQ